MAQMVNVAGVMGDSIVDGPGIRVAIFVQGCCHHCEGCHNPESWAFGAGTDMSVEELFAMVKANPLCRGVTFSGGEPFCQAGALVPLAENLKAAGYERLGKPAHSGCAQKPCRRKRRVVHGAALGGRKTGLNPGVLPCMQLW